MSALTGGGRQRSAYPHSSSVTSKDNWGMYCVPFFLAAPLWALTSNGYPPDHDRDAAESQFHRRRPTHDRICQFGVRIHPTIASTAPRRSSKVPQSRADD